ncbi:hypothetical protein A9R05_30375 [Burkholderia sp. KK1]|nr:hypothetical protein A9R05_30375 [Burkholderia sp. KK1]
MILTIIFSSHIAFAKSPCDSPVTREMALCAKTNFEQADVALNRRYVSLIQSLPEAERNGLREVQRYWVAYKTRYCQDAFKATNPGSEATFEMWSCFESVTESRIEELNFIYYSSSRKDFNSALAFMANEYEHGDRSKVIKKLVRDVPDSDSLDWKTYAGLNCRIAHQKLGEEIDTCIARMNFYKNW